MGRKNEKEIQRMCDLYKKGHTLEEVGEIVGLDASTVRYHIVDRVLLRGHRPRPGMAHGEQIADETSIKTVLDPDEDYRPIRDFEGYYVTSFGRVISCKGGAPSVISQQADKRGYWRVCLWQENRPHFDHVAHLVLENFVGPRPEDHLACHYDDDRDNNHLSNLRWGTHSDNRIDAVRNDRHNAKKLYASDVNAIRQLYRDGATQEELAQRFDVTQANISSIILRKSWAHV